MNRAFIFPGQGSQLVGMGKDFYDHFAIAKETFQIIDDALKVNLSNIIFNGPSEELTLTVNAQPALMAVSMAIFNVIKEQTGKNISELCSYVAGHSLGEYSALCAASAIDLSTTTKLLAVRGQSMQEAYPVGKGAMAACIGIPLVQLEEIIKDTGAFGVCQIANDNIEGQLVVSGELAVVENIISIVKDLGFKAIKLNVSAPFHCSLMKPAEDKMVKALNEATINKPYVPVIQNVVAEPVIDTAAIKDNLVLQVCGRVRWRETLIELERLGVQEIVEIGASKVLTSMLRKTTHQFSLVNISNLAELEEYKF